MCVWPRGRKARCNSGGRVSEHGALLRLHARKVDWPAQPLLRFLYPGRLPGTLICNLCHVRANRQRVGAHKAKAKAIQRTGARLAVADATMASLALPRLANACFWDRLWPRLSKPCLSLVFEGRRKRAACSGHDSWVQGRCLRDLHRIPLLSNRWA